MTDTFKNKKRIKLKNKKRKHPKKQKEDLNHTRKRYVIKEIIKD